MCCISFNNSTLAFQRCWGTWQHWWNPEAAWTFSRWSIGMSPEAHHGGFVKTKGTSRFNRSQDRAAFALCFWRFFDSGSPSAQWLMETWRIALKELPWNPANVSSLRFAGVFWCHFPSKSNGAPDASRHSGHVGTMWLHEPVTVVNEFGSFLERIFKQFWKYSTQYYFYVLLYCTLL